MDDSMFNCGYFFIKNETRPIPATSRERGHTRLMYYRRRPYVLLIRLTNLDQLKLDSRKVRQTQLCKGQKSTYATFLALASKGQITNP